jgi:hypothetical protein
VVDVTLQEVAVIGVVRHFVVHAVRQEDVAQFFGIVLVLCHVLDVKLVDRIGANALQNSQMEYGGLHAAQNSQVVEVVANAVLYFQEDVVHSVRVGGHEGVGVVAMSLIPKCCVFVVCVVV